MKEEGRRTESRGRRGGTSSEVYAVTLANGASSIGVRSHCISELQLRFLE